MYLFVNLEWSRKDKNENINENNCIFYSGIIIFWLTNKMFTSTCKKINFEKASSHLTKF